ncbi:MAG TPA: hypothetical protein VHW26_13190 [Solirubrobacteraceae bacterium]|jgi:hypothetical protein|nr:hypothetical protein [Solirubrobacteraceae bacterium]
MNLNRLGGCLIVATASVGLAACGSSSKSSAATTTTSTTLAKAALIARANAICTTAQSAASSITAPKSYQDPVVAAAYFDQVAPITDRETEDLLALAPASEVQAQYTAFTSARQAANTLLQTIRQKADAKDASGLEDLQKVPDAGQKVADAATALGASACAQ